MSQDGFPTRMVRILPRAIADIEGHANYLDEHATPEVAARFRTAVMSAVADIGNVPQAGAPRPNNNPKLAGLRMWSIPAFRNYLLFYLTPDNTVEIVRVIHGAQDIEALMEEEA